MLQNLQVTRKRSHHGILTPQLAPPTIPKQDTAISLATTAFSGNWMESGQVQPPTDRIVREAPATQVKADHTVLSCKEVWKEVFSFRNS